MNQITPPDSFTSAKIEAAGLTPGCANIAKDTILKGEISKCKCMEVHGAVEGIATIGHTVIHPDGKIEGTLNAQSAEIHGTFKGTLNVKSLLKITGSASVHGNIQYGQLAVEEGADLVADIRKISAQA